MSKNKIVSSSSQLSLKCDLHNAILSNSLPLVKYYLECGAQAMDSSPPLDRQTPYTESIFLLSQCQDHLIYPIHVAIVNYYHRLKEVDQEQNAASKIIDVLLTHGADVALFPQYNNNNNNQEDDDDDDGGNNTNNDSFQEDANEGTFVNDNSNGNNENNNNNNNENDTTTEPLNDINNDNAFESPNNDNYSSLAAVIRRPYECYNICFLHIGKYQRRDQTHPLSPLALVAFLRQNPMPGKESYCLLMLDTLAEVLMMRARKLAGGNLYQAGLLSSSSSLLTSMVRVPKCTLQQWSKLLFSEKYSNIHFQCPDGTILYAHKCILAMASPYFDRAFASSNDASWQHDSNGGTWKTSVSLPVMKMILSFIYTGNIPSSLSNYTTTSSSSNNNNNNRAHYRLQSVMELYQVAVEYQLSELAHWAEQACLSKLSSTSWKDMMLTAHLHNAKRLKQACLVYSQQNPHVLLEPDVLQWQTKNKSLWNDICVTLRKMRQHHSSSSQHQQQLHPLLMTGSGTSHLSFIKNKSNSNMNATSPPSSKQ